MVFSVLFSLRKQITKSDHESLKCLVFGDMFLRVQCVLAVKHTYCT